MLNFDKKGRAIAKLKSDNGKEKILYLETELQYVPPPQTGKGLPIRKKSYVCPNCQMPFVRRENLKRHLNESCPFGYLDDDINGIMEKYYNKNGAAKEKPLKNKLEEKTFTIYNNDKLVPLPNKNKRDLGYICGPQDSGKSHRVAEYIEEFHKMFPRKKVVLISGIDDDKNFNNMKYLKEIDIENEDLLDDPIEPKKEYPNSLIIFDDIDKSSLPEMTTYLESLRDDILKNGRDQSEKIPGIYCLSTNHQCTDGKKTRDLLNECTFITIFPQSGSGHGMDYILKEYLKFGPKEIKEILKMGDYSRWVTIYKKFPRYVITEKQVVLGSELGKNQML